ncbi:MAG: 3D domain-containing protein [Phascolarctobacterium sp.]|uniref:3D domain-containing protein n=1 Tax=Phascolarctobacterium sp. TaxID=2049039 RepID=UPI0026DC6507|nr:3D domain-containing protein [Phascolarctobacterium sp.]MDO4921807.1 3D domain-containing protein [Phascolarctobacterium sp.]
MKKKLPLHLPCLWAAVILILLTPLLTGFDITRRVTIEADGQTKEVRTNAASPAQILQEAGVTLEPGDGWRLQGPNKRVQDGSVITVVRGVPFSVIRGEQAAEYKSSKATVGEALKDIGIAYKKERVYPPVGEPLEPHMQIYVLGRGEELHFSEASVDIPVKYEEDHSMNFGTESVKHPGKPGKQTIVSKRIKSRDGKHSMQELTRRVTEEPESKIIRKGMAMSVYTPEGYKRYTKKMTAHASAYVATGNRTSIGIVPYEGIVAVDPRVIPYYTKMYIPGYGIAMAGDTGGDMVGNRIDLFFNDYHRAINWGRRDVEIYILAE